MSDQTVYVPDILLPQPQSLAAWPVVACDQFTSDRAYWDSLSCAVGTAPSTLRMILPECYLSDPDAAAREDRIPAVMDEYCRRGIFSPVTSFIWVTRTFASGKTRQGLMAAVDLKQYDYKKGSRPRIRATEGTVESRLPPRVRIREMCRLELPHILLLIDDPRNTVFSAVQNASGELLYDTDLCKGGGHVTGRAVSAQAVLQAFDSLAADMRTRLGEDLLMLVGDGNHSLAAAKQCYEKALREGRKDAERKRYALCEIVNLYDDGIAFEPIHRAVFGVDPQAVAEALCARTQGLPIQTVCRGGGKEYPIALPADPIEAVALVQNFLDTDPSVADSKVDYIHGDDVLYALGERSDCLAIALPPVRKEGFTDYIVRNGVLPRKTFSMGHAQEKRYYLEARYITDPIVGR